MKKVLIFLLLPLLLLSCEKEKTIFVADHYGPNNAILIKEKESDDWITFTDKIEGFDYQEGYEYTIKVKAKKEKDNITYSLINVESKNKTDFLAKQKTMQSLKNKTWEVESIYGFKNSTSKTPYFKLNDSKIRGNSGCNDFSASIEIDVLGKFIPDRLNGTKRYCEEFMDLEYAFHKAIAQAEKYKLEGEKLVFLSKTGEILFTAKEKSNKALFNKWTVSEIKGFENTTGKNPHFTIAKGEINGSNTCNSFGGDFETDKNGKFKVGMLRGTKRYCEKEANLGKVFHKALAVATQYKIRKGKLFLLNENNDLLLTAETTADVTTSEVDNKTIIEYNTYSRGLAIRNKLVGKALVYYDLRPKPTDPTKVILSDSDYAFISKEIAKLNLQKLAKLEAPSSEHKHDGAAGATLIVTKDGKLVRVPTFDHGNPPALLKPLIDKIMELRGK